MENLAYSYSPMDTDDQEAAQGDDSPAKVNEDTAQKVTTPAKVNEEAAQQVTGKAS